MNQPHPEYRFGCYRLVDGGRALLRDGVAVAVTPKVLAVLVELLRVPGRVVSKAELLESVWSGSFVEEGNLTQSISVLRKQLASDFPDDSPIETLPRIGYRFRAPVQVIHEVEPAALAVLSLPIPAAQEVAPPVVPVPAVPQTHLRGIVVLGLAVAISVGAALGISYWLHRRVIAGNRHAHRRVAVLDFHDLSQSADTAWLRAALQETIGTDLAASSDLEIVPAEDVERAERELGIGNTTGMSAETLRRLCEDLDCDEVVAGSYLSAGGSIRLDTHLFSARDGSKLGSESATEPTDHLLPLIATESQAIRKQFGLSAASSDQLQAAVSADPAAFALYARGIEQMRLYDGPAAAKFFERSIAIDPKFPLAHLAYSSALTIMSQEDRAEQEAQTALSLSGNLPRRTQLAIEARAEQTEHRFDQAANTFQTLSTFFPDDLEYLWMRAAMLDYAGHSQESINLLLPLVTGKSSGSNNATDAVRDPRFYSQLSDTYSTLGDWPASLTWAQRGEQEARRRGATLLYERLLTSESQAELYLHQLPLAEARTQEALQLARQFDDRSGELRALNRMGQIETAEGRLPEARAMLEQALALEASAGEVQRQIHTLSALGQNLERSGNHAEAMATFQHELELAKPFGQPDTILGAQLDVAREQIVSGHEQAGRDLLQNIERQAQALGDKQLQAEADEAIQHAPSRL